MVSFHADGVDAEPDDKRSAVGLGLRRGQRRGNREENKNGDTQDKGIHAAHSDRRVRGSTAGGNVEDPAGMRSRAAGGTAGGNPAALAEDVEVSQEPPEQQEDQNRSETAGSEFLRAVTRDECPKELAHAPETSHFPRGDTAFLRGASRDASRRRYYPYTIP